MGVRYSRKTHSKDFTAHSADGLADSEIDRYAYEFDIVAQVVCYNCLDATTPTFDDFYLLTVVAKNSVDT